MKEAKVIFEEMLRVFQEKTGLNMAHSADLAVRLYAAAAQLESLYGYCDWALRQSFPQTATGEYLDKHAQMRFLSRKGGEKARGSVTFYLSEMQTEPISVPAGTVVTTASLVRFQTLEDAVIAPGGLSAQALAEAEEAGAHGNVSAGAVTKMPRMPVAVTGCENPEAFTGGADGETDEALRARILESYRRLPNGANAAFYESRVLQHGDVAAVKVLPRRRGAGTVDILVAGREGLPSEALLAELKEDIDRYRELAVDVSVAAPDAIPVAVRVTVWPREGVGEEEACAAAETAVKSFFDGSALGRSVYLAELGSRIFATGKVKNYVITSPAEDVLCGETELPILSQLTVTEGE